MPTIGYERGIRGGYHDHANIVSMIGCPRVKQVHWLSDLVLSLLTGNWAQAESFTCPTERGSARLTLPLDHRYRSRQVQWGFRDHYRGREVVSAGGPAALVMELRPLAEMIPGTALVAVVDRTDFLELAVMLLPLRLHFLITCVLRDSGRATPWSFYRGEKIKFSIIPNH